MIDGQSGYDLINDWCVFNNYTLMKEPEIVMFPPPSEYHKNKFQDCNDYAGYTGFGILKESHISIHTYPEVNFIALDFYSCNEVDSNKNKDFILNYINEKFRETPIKMKMEVIQRPYDI